MCSVNHGQTRILDQMPHNESPGAEGQAVSAVIEGENRKRSETRNSATGKIAVTTRSPRLVEHPHDTTSLTLAGSLRCPLNRATERQHVIQNAAARTYPGSEASHTLLRCAAGSSRSLPMQLQLTYSWVASKGGHERPSREVVGGIPSDRSSVPCSSSVRSQWSSIISTIQKSRLLDVSMLSQWAYS